MYPWAGFSRRIRFISTDGEPVPASLFGASLEEPALPMLHQKPRPSLPGTVGVVFSKAPPFAATLFSSWTIRSAGSMALPLATLAMAARRACSMVRPNAFSSHACERISAKAPSSARESTVRA